ncbi:hypothetical protein COLO4_09028 [Corchorus olitorius]|uniref:Uncharacterized protein n=1 Tax=Corchorus olitorius TaxID=93759 RepID=A0A1R3KDF8_9ROSI|nr:hypothetical protein COLO4_09028 [Corchorus olitorius]
MDYIDQGLPHVLELCFLLVYLELSFVKLRLFNGDHSLRLEQRIEALSRGEEDLGFAKRGDLRKKKVAEAR